MGGAANHATAHASRVMVPVGRTVTCVSVGTPLSMGSAPWSTACRASSLMELNVSVTHVMHPVKPALDLKLWTAPHVLKATSWTRKVPVWIIVPWVHMLIPPPSCVRIAPLAVRPVRGPVKTVLAAPQATTRCSFTRGGAGLTAQMVSLRRTRDHVTSATAPV